MLLTATVLSKTLSRAKGENQPTLVRTLIVLDKEHLFSDITLVDGDVGTSTEESRKLANELAYGDKVTIEIKKV
jgi:hypothetical protein